jgi:hypothetical protein
MKCQSQRGYVLKIGLQMIEQSTSGLLFFRGGREVHACVAYDVTQTSARMYSDELGLLPIKFFRHVRQLSNDRQMPTGLEAPRPYRSGFRKVARCPGARRQSTRASSVSYR